MVTINQDIFLEQNANSKILENVTKFCSRCYNEFKENDFIYYDIENFRYLCGECACCISEELQTSQECLLDECEKDGGLFGF